MQIKLDTVQSVLTILAAAGGFAGFLFAVLRYIIRSETTELRPNHGGSIKDVVHRISERLEDHIADSQVRIERGAEVEAELRQTISDLAAAMPVVAGSTPPDGTAASHAAS